jgi:hypothetical protein
MAATRAYTRTPPPRIDRVFRAARRRQKARRWIDRLLTLAGLKSSGRRLPDDVRLALS